VVGAPGPGRLVGAHPAHQRLWPRPLAHRRDAGVAEIASFGALGPPGGLGLLLAAPTIATHGTQEQIDLYVRGIVTGQQGWCQLFSEPAPDRTWPACTTRATKDGDEWVINGQKVWTSLGQFADLGMLLARTDPEVPKHQGITWMVLDMHQPVSMSVRSAR
jgi:alkylation response protein AidB-like acyl-CoA dehydrogenase